MSIRIAGVVLPNNKNIDVAITSIYGIGISRARGILAELGINNLVKTKSLKEADVNRLREAIEKKFVLEGDLRRELQANIRRLKEISSYRGSRHIKNLPVRGQRTKTNSRTVRGNKRVTAASGRAKAASKT